MLITFGPVRRAKNLHDRRLDFLDAGLVLSGPVFTVRMPGSTMANRVFRQLDFLPVGW
jgi:hypothetical protein